MSVAGLKKPKGFGFGYSVLNENSAGYEYDALKIDPGSMRR